MTPVVVEFSYGPLAADPRRLGTPLREGFEGEWSARRGVYRVLHRLHDEERIVVTRIAHRSTVYRVR